MDELPRVSLKRALPSPDLSHEASSFKKQKQSQEHTISLSTPAQIHLERSLPSPDLSDEALPFKRQKLSQGHTVPLAPPAPQTVPESSLPCPDLGNEASPPQTQKLPQELNKTSVLASPFPDPPVPDASLKRSPPSPDPSNEASPPKKPLATPTTEVPAPPPTQVLLTPPNSQAKSSRRSVASWVQEVQASNRRTMPASSFQKGATLPEPENLLVVLEDCGAIEKGLDLTANPLVVLRENAGRAASVPASVFSVPSMSDEESISAEESPEELPEEDNPHETSEENAADTKSTRRRAAPTCRSDTASYRQTVLKPHGIYVMRPAAIPPAVKDMALSVMTKEREEPGFSAEQIIHVQRQIARAAEAGETMLTQVLVPLLCPGYWQFPTDRGGEIIREGVDRLWNLAGMPCVKQPGVYSLSKPKPDRHYGFAEAAFGKPLSRLLELLEHQLVKDHAHPNSENYFPFMIMEFKSEACFGHFRHAENQAAGGGALCVNSTKQFLKLAGSTEPDMLNTIAFSCLINARIADVWVHWHEPATDVQEYADSTNEGFCSAELIRYYIDTPDGSQMFMNAIRNILDWGAQSRLPVLRAALVQLANKGGLGWLEQETKLLAQASAKAAAEAKLAAQAFAKAAAGEAEGRSVAGGGNTGSKSSGSRVKAGRVTKPQAPVKTSATRKRPATV